MAEEGKDLKDTIYRVSSEAFKLAQEAVQGGDIAALEARARAVDSRLDALAPQIDTVAAAEQPELDSIWTDGRLDVMYVLSGGTQPTSTRLFHFQEDLKKK